MADQPDEPKASPAVPDLKKALENKLAGPAAAPGAVFARSAASAAGGGRAADATFAERLKTPVGLACVLGLGLLIGGVAFYFTAISAGESGGATAPGGMPTAFKFHAARGQDSIKLFPPRVDDVNQDRMRIGAMAGMARQPGPGAGKDGGTAGDGADGGEPPMHYDQEGMGGAGGAAGSGGAAAAGQENAGAAAGRAGKSAAPKLVSSVNFKGMHMVSGTAGFRGLKSGRSILKEAISAKGSRTSSSGDIDRSAGGGANSVASSAATARTGSQGLASQSEAGGGDGAASASGSGGGGGGGGGSGGGGAAPADLKAPDDPRAQVQSLLSGAAADADTASTEKKRSEILAALGQLPQAAYHYDRYEKAKKSSDQKTAQANQLLTTLQSQTQAMTNEAASH